MLILASRSAIRKTLLEQAGLAFSARSTDVNERSVENEVVGRGGGPADIALALSEAKARSIPDALAIGADQVLELEGALLHKPSDMDEARERLDALRGKTHHLHAGVAIARAGDLLWSTVETASLTMRDFAAAERDRVLALEGDAILGSVGAYRFEGPSIRLFARIVGDYHAILGLPLLPLLAALREHAPEVFEGLS